MTQTDDRLPNILAGLKRALSELDVRVTMDQIDDTTRLFDGGLGLDSFAIVELIVRVEQEFSFEFHESDLRPEVFVDVITLANVIARNTTWPG
jgi:acyl carrier protein